MNVEFTLNGEPVSISAHPCERLSDILHDRLGVQSVRSGCSIGKCGSCMILMDGKALPSCLVPAFQARRREVLTLEGFKKSDEFRDLERAFAEVGVQTCGFCLPAKLLSAHQIIEEHPGGDRSLILEGLSGVSCRCTEITALVKAVELAMEFRRERRYGPER